MSASYSSDRSMPRPNARVSLDSRYKLLPGASYRVPVGGVPRPLPTNSKSKFNASDDENTTKEETNAKPQKTLQQACREEIENLHGIFVCWFKGLQAKEDLEKELKERITTNFSHIAPNGQFVKGSENLLRNLSGKYGAYPRDAFDIQIENVRVIWALHDLCLVTYEEWQWWHLGTGTTKDDTNGGNTATAGFKEEDTVRVGRLSSCLLRQRPGCFHWIHVHETWLEGASPNDVCNGSDDNKSEDVAANDVDVDVKNKSGAARNDKKKIPANGEKDGNNLRVRFSSDEGDDKGPNGTPPEQSALSLPNENGNRGASKTLKMKAKEKEKPVVQLTPVPPNVQAPLNASRRRHISPQLTDYAKACMVNNELIGISINGWDIGTGQGPMGDEGWFSAATTNFENMSQYQEPSSSNNNNHHRLRRRIAMPEMVFPAAHVAFEHRQDNLWISWDVLDAMDDWARAHQGIPVNSDQEHFGVSVLKSVDAALWAKKKKHVIPDNAASKDAFHFDWTYSTPFCGSVEGGYWEKLPQTGLKLEMLKDKSSPILFFDELVLYEDDFHDNGCVQYSLKIRVMPTCGFVLARLWVRIDRVLLRLRETRVMFEFGKTPNEVAKVYRDVTWRECPWQDLAKHNLPTNLKLWCSPGQETPQLAMLMSKLPEVDPPETIFKHAILKRGAKS